MGAGRELLLKRAREVRRSFERALYVELPVDVLEQVRAAAAMRGVRPEVLARRILATAVDDDLVDALLDDSDEIERLSDQRAMAESQRARGGFARRA